MVDLRTGANDAISNAMRSGQLPRPAGQPCVRCGGPALIYHHHLGYAREHWYDVVPMCPPCHVKEPHERPTTEDGPRNPRRKRPIGRNNPRVTIEVYDDEAALIRRFRMAAIMAKVSLRDWLLQAGTEKLERDRDA
jgi:hypothetical protein